MKFLYSPWRKNYVNDIRESKKDKASDQDCIFCQQVNNKDDEKNFILRRFTHNFVMLNLYPYNHGHLMVVPFAHKPMLCDLAMAERAELIELVSTSCNILQMNQKAEGINVGLNLGKAAGAGIPSHLHMHVLPRWIGDTNFMPLLADTKVFSINLAELYKELKPQFANL